METWFIGEKNALNGLHQQLTQVVLQLEINSERLSIMFDNDEYIDAKTVTEC